MGAIDRIIDGIKGQVEMRGDIERLTARVDRISDDVVDHEKRLIRLETVVEMARGDFAARRLPRD